MVALFPSVTDYIGLAGAFFLFGSVFMAGVVFGFFLLPETRGKTIQNVNHMFYNQHSQKGSCYEDYLKCPQK